MIHHPCEYINECHVNIIRADAQQAEKTGRLTNGQLQLVYQQQWLKLLVPQVYGGQQLPLPDMVKLEEALSWADGSVGWVVTLCAGAGWFGGFMQPAVCTHVFSPKNACIAGSGAATGTAEIVFGGYVINGSWQYASGVHLATHITVNCVLQHAGKPLHQPNGKPTIKPFIIDTQEVEIINGWKYMGMIATGSDGYEVNNVFVDEVRCFEILPGAAVIQQPLYQYPFIQLAEATLAANLAGMAIRFVDICKTVFEQKQQDQRLTSFQKELLTDLWQLQWVTLSNHRLVFYEALAASWLQPQNNNLLDGVSNTSRRLAKAARDSVHQLYPFCGLMAAAPDTELNRVWRNLHTASQHSLLTFEH